MSLSEDRTVPTEYRPCRLYHHAWEPRNVKQQGHDWVQILVCTRCGTERISRVNGYDGLPKGSRYSYPEGYLLQGGGALSQSERGELRLAELTGKLRKRRRGKQ